MFDSSALSSVHWVAVGYAVRAGEKEADDAT